MAASQKPALHFGLNGLMIVISTEEEEENCNGSSASRSGIDPLVVRVVGEV